MLSVKVIRFPCSSYRHLFFKANNASALSNSSFVPQAVNELVHANLVEEIFDQGFHLFKFDLNLSQDTITLRFFPRIKSFLPSLGILEPVL